MKWGPGFVSQRSAAHMWRNSLHSQDKFRQTNSDGNFKLGQFQTAFLVAGTNLEHLKMSVIEIWTNLKGLYLSFYG